ncbi:MAG: hypothetical protein WB784_05110 [Rhodanobacteraceae bacterium]
MSRRLYTVFATFSVLAASCYASAAFAKKHHHASLDAQQAAMSAEIAALKSQVAQLQARVPTPELGHQMLQLQIRHDRLWWAGQGGNWTLAYFMTGELGEALRGIEQTNGEAAELQPQKLSEVMPSIMDPAIKEMQAALAKQDKGAFDKAFDNLSAACTACHQVAGNLFLVIQRPVTPLLDNLRYAPPAVAAKEP